MIVIDFIGWTVGTFVLVMAAAVVVVGCAELLRGPR